VESLDDVSLGAVCSLAPAQLICVVTAILKQTHTPIMQSDVGKKQLTFRMESLNFVFLGTVISQHLLHT
jgi:hypothetical protein